MSDEKSTIDMTQNPEGVQIAVLLSNVKTTIDMAQYPGEVQIVVLMGENTFIAWGQRSNIENIMDAFEKRVCLSPDDRTNQISHCQIRMFAAQHLRLLNAEELFRDLFAAGSMWLALRHWSNSAEMQKGLDEQLASEGRAVITVSIADKTPQNIQPDTAWSFMIGSQIHDGRSKLAEIEPGRVKVITRYGGDQL